MTLFDEAPDELRGHVARPGEKLWIVGKDERCRARIWVKDTYRRTGRGKSGFEMHYTAKRCSRRATEAGRCWQHSADLGFMDYDSQPASCD